MAEEILKDKNREDYFLILKICSTPISGGEVMKIKTKRDVFEYVVKLKNSGLITFMDGKYFTTEQGKKLLNGINGK